MLEICLKNVRNMLDLYGWNYAARPEGAEALSPGQRPGYNGNEQGALNQRSPAHSGKVKGKSFKIHLTQLSQIGKFKKLKPYALQLKIQTIRLLS